MSTPKPTNAPSSLSRRGFIQCLALAGCSAILPPSLMGNALKSAVHLNSFHAQYDFKIERGWLKMKDGVRLAVTYYIPIVPASKKIPVLLEMHPYRKDDICYIGDYESYTWFARRGFATARVDIRGTGSSEGMTVPYEYSPIELADGEEIIAQLARLPWSNGNVGMIGISWSANNALMLALRNPPALKTIVISHASDDLFHDDVHYIDGINTVNDYESLMEGDNPFPRSPDYPLDEDYFHNRFEAYPWFLTYMKQQRDGDFWRKESSRYHTQDLRIPIFIFGGLLDGYRDTLLRLLEGAKGVVRADMGPYNHDYPDYAVPGPNYEWRYDVLRWLDLWLNGVQNGIENEARFNVFVRAGNPPDDNMTTTPGKWRVEDWPIARTQWTAYYPATQGLLSKRAEKKGVDKLPYRAGFGAEASGWGNWWGEISQDMTSSDEGALVYDSPPLTQKVEIIGFPQVQLRTSVDAALADWVVRLEDVQPDGSVTLVTGGALNGAQRDSPLLPSALQPGKPYDLSFQLHFTTWTFQPGHRIRLSVTNAQFPMFWPTPYPMAMRLFVGETATCIKLPVIPAEKSPVPKRSEVDSVYEEPPDARYLVGEATPVEGGLPTYHPLRRNEQTGEVSIKNEAKGSYEVQGRTYTWQDTFTRQTNEHDPSQSRFLGTSERKVKLSKRIVSLSVRIDMQSTRTDFHIILSRKLYENGKLVKEKVWDEVIPRDFQ